MTIFILMKPLPFATFFGNLTSGATARAGVPAEGESSPSNSQSNRPLAAGVVALFACGLLLLPGSNAVQAQQLSASALAQIAALQQEKETRTPAQKKISSQLVFAAKESRNQIIAGGVPKLSSGISRAANGGVMVDIKATVTADLLAAITRLGGTIHSSFPQFNFVRATLPLSALETIAARSDVKSIRQPDLPHTKNVGAEKPARTLLAQNSAGDDQSEADGETVRAAVTQNFVARASQGSVVSEGDSAHGADIARAKYKVDGSGVKVGIISDGVNTLKRSQASGDLPTNLIVLPGQAGSGNEGTAMLEIVHDLVPGAQLIFATSGDSPAQMAQNILDLRKAGCDVIIDDISFPTDDYPFQAGLVEKAVDQVAASGALYFSASGNTGNKKDNTSSTFRGDFRDGGATSSIFAKAGRLNDFGGGRTFNTYAGATAAQSSAILFWTDPVDASSNDYDLYVLDAAGQNVVLASNDTQGGTGSPVEFIGTGIQDDQRVVIVKNTGSQDRFLHLDVGGGGGPTLSISTDGSVRGHAATAAANMFSVSATSAQNAKGGLFTGGAANPVETFTDDGPRRLYFDPNGNPISGNLSSTGGRVLQKPDITAADNGKTSAPGFEVFPGTSAAAPHAGAIAALLLSFNRKLSPAQVRGFLQSTALDIESPGFDNVSGVGIIMANRSLDAAAAANKPSGIGVSIRPFGPRTNDTLTAIPRTTTPDGATYSYQWSVNGTPIPNATKQTLDLSVAGQGDKGQVVSVLLTATAGADTGSTATNSVTVINSVPTVRDATITGRAGTEIVVPLVASDPDNDALTFKSVGGPRNGTGVFTVRNGQPVFVYRSRLDFSGAETISFVATDTSQQTSNIANINITVNVASQPIGLGVQLMPFSPRTNDTLTATPIIRDRTGVTLSYAWTVNGKLLPNEKTNQLSLAKPGNGEPEDMIRVVVTATRGLDRGQATNNVKVFNNAPATFSVRGTATSGQSVSFTLRGTDADGERLTFRRVERLIGGTSVIVNNSDNTATLTYTSRADFTGREVIEFVATDPHGRTSPRATVTIDVSKSGISAIQSAPSAGGS